jgi:hypothetical protein
MVAFCTIVTESFLPFSKALNHSLQVHGGAELIVFITSDFESTTEETPFKKIYLSSLANSVELQSLNTKIKNTNLDAYRWALKPFVILHLLKSQYDKVIYCDPDIFFIGNYQFLIDKLENSGILLTPHWNSIIPSNLDETMPSLFRGGLFNAGFIGASKKGLQAITWWLWACIYKMDHTELSGYFDDQKYLDVLPIEFENVEIIKHRGCNLACWNIEANKRSMMDSKLLINEEYEPVFIHFTKNTSDHIFKGYDELLRPYLTNYIGLLKENGFDADKFYPDTDKLTGISIFENLKRKTLIRTRLKRFLTKLIKKI